jgi:hypothetical protein
MPGAALSLKRFACHPHEGQHQDGAAATSDWRGRCCATHPGGERLPRQATWPPHVHRAMPAAPKGSGPGPPHPMFPIASSVGGWLPLLSRYAASLGSRTGSTLSRYSRRPAPRHSGLSGHSCSYRVRSGLPRHRGCRTGRRSSLNQRRARSYLAAHRCRHRGTAAHELPRA